MSFIPLLSTDDGPLEGWTAASWRHGISDVGSGQVEGDPDLVDVNDIVTCAADGVRFEWRVEDEDRVDDDSTSKMWSGRGLAADLGRTIVLPSGYPSHTSRVRSMSGAPLAIWRTLVLEAQARGRLSWLTVGFDATTDSNGDAWSETVDVELEPGVDLLSLLDSMCDVEGAEWVVDPDGTLRAAPQVGTDRSDQVVLFVGRDQLQRRRRTSARDLRQTIYLEASTGVSEATSAAGVDAGELWLESEDFADPTSRASVASRIAANAGAEKVEVEVSVPAGCGLYDTFQVGDLVGLDDGVDISAVRVVAATVSQTDQTEVELTLVDQQELRRQTIERAIEAKADVKLAANVSLQRRHGLVRADKIETGSLQADADISSSDFVAGSAGWRIRGDGEVEFDRGTFRGTLSAAGGTFSGDLSAAGGTFTGTLSGVDGTFSGTLDAASGTFGTITSGTYEGTISLASGNLTIDDSGIEMQQSSSFTYSRIRWLSGGSLVGQIVGAPGSLKVEHSSGLASLEGGGTSVAAGSSSVNINSAGILTMGPSGVANDQIEHQRRSQTGLTWQVLRPLVDGQGILGNSSRRWERLYSVNPETASSDERLKDIDGDAPGLTFVESLRPIAFRRKANIPVRARQAALTRRERVERANGIPAGTLTDEQAESFDDTLVEEPPAPDDGRLHFGFSAQEVHAVVGDSHDIVQHDPDTDSWGIAYSELIAPLYRAVQELSARVGEVERRGR